MDRDMIIEEYKRAEIHFRAMAALLEAEGISLEGASESPKQTAALPEPVQKPQESEKQDTPQSTEPGIVYSGKTEYTPAPGEHVIFSVYFNGVSSSGDYRIMPSGSPTFIDPVISGSRTSTGFKVDFDVRAVRTGQGSIKMYIKSAPEEVLNIVFNVK